MCYEHEPALSLRHKKYYYMVLFVFITLKVTHRELSAEANISKCYSSSAPGCNFDQPLKVILEKKMHDQRADLLFLYFCENQILIRFLSNESQIGQIVLRIRILFSFLPFPQQILSPAFVVVSHSRNLPLHLTTQLSHLCSI